MPGPKKCDCGKDIFNIQKAAAVKLLDVFSDVQIMHVGKSLT